MGSVLTYSHLQRRLGGLPYFCSSQVESASQVLPRPTSSWPSFEFFSTAQAYVPYPLRCVRKKHIDSSSTRCALGSDFDIDSVDSKRGVRRVQSLDAVLGFNGNSQLPFIRRRSRTGCFQLTMSAGVFFLALSIAMLGAIFSQRYKCPRLWSSGWLRVPNRRRRCSLERRTQETITLTSSASVLKNMTSLSRGILELPGGISLDLLQIFKVLQNACHRPWRRK